MLPACLFATVCGLIYCAGSLGDAFASAEHVGGAVSITNNQGLVTPGTSFSGLLSVAAGVNIENNPALTSLGKRLTPRTSCYCTSGTPHQRVKHAMTRIPGIHTK